MKRGEVWWVELPAPVGSRPAVILTRDAVVETIGAIVVSLVTRTSRNISSELSLGRREGLPRPCVASMDNILTVPRHRLIRQMGMLTKERIEELNRALRFSLDIG
jgi:mRNA interferase MazF